RRLVGGPGHPDPALGWARLPLRERRIGLRGLRRLRLHAGSVAAGELGARVDDRAGVPPRPRREDDAGAVSGADEDVLGARRAVDEVPGPEWALLTLHDQHALAGEHEEVLLVLLRVVHAARPARLDDAEREPDLAEGR